MASETAWLIEVGQATPNASAEFLASRQKFKRQRVRRAAQAK